MLWTLSVLKCAEFSFLNARKKLKCASNTPRAHPFILIRGFVWLLTAEYLSSFFKFLNFAKFETYKWLLIIRIVAQYLLILFLLLYRASWIKPVFSLQVQFQIYDLRSCHLVFKVYCDNKWMQYFICVFTLLGAEISVEDAADVLDLVGKSMGMFLNTKTAFAIWQEEHLHHPVESKYW